MNATILCLKRISLNINSLNTIKSVLTSTRHSTRHSLHWRLSTLIEVKRMESKSASKEADKKIDFNPSKSNYSAREDACWAQDERVPYLALATTLQVIENTSSRLKMIEILCNYFRSVIVLSPNDLLPSVYLCLNKLGPDYEGLELGIGESLIMKALAQATGRKTDKIRADIEKKGDLGLVAEESRVNQKVLFSPPKLTVYGVFNKFKEIARLTGNSTQSLKVDNIQRLLVACRSCEARYLVRSLTGKLRIGLAEQSLLAALAQAFLIGDREVNRSSEKFKNKVAKAVESLKTAHCECPNYDIILPILLNHGLDELQEHVKLTLGIPLKPMLAHPSKGVDEVLRRFENAKFTCEYKYDGERAQIHMKDHRNIFVFSRNQENNTSKYPDIISRIPDVVNDVNNFIIDCEAVAWDRGTKEILPFQVLSTRKRKNANENEIQVQVCLFAFDLLFLNDTSLVKEPFSKRRELLRAHFKEVEGKFMFTCAKDVDSVEEIEEFLEESIKNKCEGLMVKTLDVDSTYEIAKRSHNWLKLKKDYLEGIGDTLDLVVIGGYYGKGKRTGLYGGFLLACYDEDREEYQTICKIGTGFKDSDLEKHSEFLNNIKIQQPKGYYNYHQNLEPDVWFDAVQVWEVKCADLSISPVYKAASGDVDPQKGISLRFPRFVRIREDKKPEEATTTSQVVQLYTNQSHIKGSQANGGENGEEEDHDNDE